MIGMGALLKSCEQGYIDLANLMISKGADDGDLARVCEYSNEKLINLMITKGATKCDYCDFNHNF